MAMTNEIKMIEALEKLVWIDTVEEVLSNFCPNCGAKMQKGGK